jgi:HPt (histidine-containing phosphotransfer) domain-containing protein
MNTHSIIDLPVFEALREAMGADYMIEVVQVYFEETPQLLTQLKEALAKKDCEVFRRSAHSIKSTSNSFGALQFGMQAKELEMMGRECKLEGAASKVEALEADYLLVRQALEELSHAQ